MWGVYDLKNNEQCVGVFDKRKQVADFVGFAHETSVNIAASRNSIVHKKFKIVKIEEGEFYG